jgi:replicative DNA helicase
MFLSESSAREMTQKLIAKKTGIDSEAFSYQDSPLSPEEKARVEEARKALVGYPIYFEDSSKLNIKYIVERTEKVKVTHPDLALVVVDGMQAFECPPKANKSDFYYGILQDLKRLAKYIGVTVIANGQLKAIVEERRDKKPRGLEDFSDCKGIPEVADAALMLYRPEFYWPDEAKYKGWMSVIPMAMRTGDKKDKQFRLGVDMKTATISEWTDDITQKV